MRRLWFWTLLFIVVLLNPFPNAPAFGKSNHTETTAAGAEVVQHVLDNGLEVLLVRRPSVPVAVVDVWVGVGSANETTANNGIAHFFEHMLFKGTPTRAVGAVDLEVDSLGGANNAATSLDWTHYYISVPSEQIAQAIDILADMTQNASFPEDEIVSEKEVVLRERDQRDDNPGSSLYRNFQTAFFGDHPYGLPTIGTAEGLDPQTRDDFLAFKDLHYVPGNMTVVVVGDIDLEATLAVIEEKFGDMESGETPALNPPAPQARTETEVIEIERDVSQGYLIMGWPGPSVQDREDVYAMDVLLNILSGGRGSRFYRNIQKELGIVTSVDAGYFTTRHPSNFNVSAVFPYENRALVEKTILAELSKILDGDVQESEVTRAKTMLLSQVAIGRENNSGFASDLGFYAVVADDYTFALTYPEGIASVTAVDITNVARKYINLDAYLEVVLVPTEAAPTEETTDLQTLDNGLKLLVRADPSSDVVALHTFVGVGNAVESAEQAGITALTQRLLLRGTQTHSEEEIFEITENLGASLGQDTLADMGDISLVATADTWQEALPVYLDVLLNPKFAEEEFARVKDEMLREVEASQDDFFAAIYDNFRGTLYGAGGYGNPSLGTVDSLNNITLDDVKAFYTKYYVPNNMVISAVGNFDAQALAARLRARFNTLVPGADDLAPAVAPIDLTENAQISVTRESNLTWFILGFPGPAVADEDYAAAKVLNSILGGGMSSRLFTILRDEQGLAYSTGSFFPSRRGPSHLVTYIIALPENAEPAKDGILEILTNIRDSGVDEQELQRAKNKELGDFLLQHETAERRAWYLGWYEMMGAGYTRDAEYPDLIRAITSEDVQRVAEKYLQTYVVSLLGPQQ